MIRKRIGIAFIALAMIATSFTILPNLSFAKSTYHNYAPDKIGKTTEGVNMRSTASTKAKKLMTIPKGKSITLYGYYEVPGINWYKVGYGGKIGYVIRTYVKQTGTKASKPAATPEKPVGKYVNYAPDKIGKTTAGVYMRSTSSTKGKKITTVPKGKTITIYGYDSIPGTDWYKVKYGSKTGYIIRTYVKITGTVKTNSSITIKNHSVPKGTITEGSFFQFKGQVSSKYALSQVEVGVVDANGQEVDSCYVTEKPKTTKYDIKKVDNELSFNLLGDGNYRYTIKGKDSKGYSKTLINQSFTIQGRNVTINPLGKELEYNDTVFQQIGKQPYSGPCGLYAMAYGRLVIDGTFNLKIGSKNEDKFPTVCDQLINDYGMGTHAAHWSNAGAGSVWTTSAKNAYKGVIEQINNGKPCIIPVNGPYGQHFILIIGYSPGTTNSNLGLSRFIALDPAFGVKVPAGQLTKGQFSYKDKPASEARYIPFSQY